jgi:drug/metabolite transporter (DMT)-like permease
MQPLLFATLAAVGNAIFVYGQRGTNPSENPFLFVCGAVAVCLAMFLAASFLYRTPGDGNYVMENWGMITISGIGFFLTFVGFFLLYNKFGASQYSLYAVISILTTSVGVGFIIFREPFNIFQIGGIVLAIGSIVLFTYGKSKGV